MSEPTGYRHFAHRGAMLSAMRSIEGRTIMV
jgi:hypothetical protein